MHARTHARTGADCFYQMEHEDQCFNNTFILGHPRPHASSTLP